MLNPRSEYMPEINDDVQVALMRYVGEYHWGWNMAGRLLRRKFGVELTEKELKALYAKLIKK